MDLNELMDGWKVDLARQVKKKIESKPIDDEHALTKKWVSLFETLESAPAN